MYVLAALCTDTFKIMFGMEILSISIPKIRALTESFKKYDRI